MTAPEMISCTIRLYYRGKIYIYFDNIVLFFPKKKLSIHTEDRMTNEKILLYTV